MYENCNDDGISSFVETLKLSAYLHKDGVARIRITELLEQKSSTNNGRGDDDGGIAGPISTPRWTSDELVLNEKEMIGANGDNVRIIHTNQLIPSRLGLNIPLEDDGSNSDKDKMHNFSILSSSSSLIGRASTHHHQTSIILLPFPRARRWANFS